MVSLKECMELLVAKAKVFACEIFTDSRGNVTGFRCQTSIMRDNFERFGSFLSMHAIKRGINQWLWPHLSITLHNDMNKECVGCEAIVFLERNDAYKSLIELCIEHSPKASREDIFVVTTYGFVTQDCVTKIFVLLNDHLCQINVICSIH